MYQTDSGDSHKTEETTPVSENLTDNQEGDAGVMPESIQAEGQNPSSDDSVAENAASENASAETEALSEDADIAEWLDIVDTDEKTPDSGENTDDKSDDRPDETPMNKKIAELEAKSEELAEQLADSRDQLLRKAADFENFRKRMNQEKQSAIEFANQTLLLDIIPIIDDFERAIQSAEASTELTNLSAGKALLDGITMIEKRLVSQLESKWGLKRFNSAGEVFDPNRHEAMMMEKSPDVGEATVQEDFIKGYMLKDRVIRAAKVKVIMPENDEGTASLG